MAEYQANNVVIASQSTENFSILRGVVENICNHELEQKLRIEERVWPLKDNLINPNTSLVIIDGEYPLDKLEEGIKSFGLNLG